MVQRLLGKQVAYGLVRPVFYNHFVAGDTAEAIQHTINSLDNAGIAPLLAVPVEEVSSDSDYDTNYLAMLKCLSLAAQLDQRTPMMQLKMTALVPKNILMNLNVAYWSDKQEQLIDDVAGIFRTGRDGDCRLLRYVAKNDYERFLKSICNLAEIGKAATTKRVRVLVDAEYSYINGGLSLLTQAAALNYNLEQPLIWNTYQCYLKSAKENVQREFTWAENRGLSFGAKIVRGAYLQYENGHAKSHGSPSPIHDSLENTHASYDEVVDFMLHATARLGGKCNVIIASHNEHSVLKAVQRMAELKMQPDVRHVFFGQLMGMCDHVSYTLGQAGYPVYKSLPFGSVAATIPYLSRRAQENSSVIQGARRERQLLTKELKHRVIGRQAPRI